MDGFVLLQLLIPIGGFFALILFPAMIIEVVCERIERKKERARQRRIAQRIKEQRRKAS